MLYLHGPQLLRQYPDSVQTLSQFAQTWALQTKLEELQLLPLRPGACGCNLHDELVRRVHDHVPDHEHPPLLKMRCLADGVFLDYTGPWPF